MLSAFAACLSFEGIVDEAHNHAHLLAVHGRTSGSRLLHHESWQFQLQSPWYCVKSPSIFVMWINTNSCISRTSCQSSHQTRGVVLQFAVCRRNHPKLLDTLSYRMTSSGRLNITTDHNRIAVSLDVSSRTTIIATVIVHQVP